MKSQKLGQHIVQIRGISFKPEDVICEQLNGFVPIIKSNNIKEDVLTDKISGEWGVEPEDDGVKILRTTNFTNLGVIDFKDIVLRKIEPKKIEQKKLLTGDVIIEKSGGSPTQPVGRVVYFENPDDSIYLCNNFTTVLRPNKDKVYPKFLFYVLFYNHLTKRTLRYQNKTTGIINLQLEKYLLSEISLPSLDDQIRIAAVLTRAEKLIAKRKESIKSLDEFLKSTFLEMFGDPVRNEKGWDVVELGSLSNEFKYGTNMISDDKNSDEKMPILRIPNVVGERISYTDLKYSMIDNDEKEKIRLKIGDLLFVRTNGNPAYIGRCAVFNDSIECGYASYLIRVRLKDNSTVSSHFVRDVISFPTYRHLVIDKAKTTAGNYNINTESLKSLKIYQPPVALQNKFAAIVEKVEAMKVKYNESLVEMEKLYGGLSQRAFRGEL